MIKFKTYDSPWTDLRTEVKKIREQLKINETSLREVNITHWEGILEKVWKEFSTRKSSRWIWESLKQPTYGFYINSYELLDLTEIVDENEPVWFILDESVNMKTKFWVYEGLITSFNKIIWECNYVDEILIVSKKYEWLISINHHDIISGTKEMIHKLKKLENKINTAGNNGEHAGPL